jgi:hypothetical protein
MTAQHFHRQSVVTAQLARQRHLAAVHAASAAVIAAISSQPTTIVVDPIADAADPVRPVHTRLEWTELPGGKVMARALDESGTEMASGIGDDWQDALLDLAEFLQPPSGQPE